MLEQYIRAAHTAISETTQKKPETRERVEAEHRISPVKSKAAHQKFIAIVLKNIFQKYTVKARNILKINFQVKPIIDAQKNHFSINRKIISIDIEMQIMTMESSITFKIY
jgi:hypothetical protein